MNDTDLAATLAEAIAATGVARYRHLCSDANTRPPPNSPADWRRFILERRWEAQALPAAARPPVAESLDLTRRMDRCPYRSRCSCSGGRCALKGGAVVSHVDCFDCLRRHPE